MTAPHTSPLVGLVGFGGFSSDDRRTEICETAPEADPGVVGLVGFGGCLAVNGAHKFCAEADSSKSAVVGLVGFGGFAPANRPSTLGPDAGLTDADKALANAARGILRTLEEARLTLAVTESGALQVSPASTLRIDQRVAIGQHRAGLVALLRLRGALFVEDDRHRCRDCVHLLRKGNCAVALRGQMPGVKAWFMPAPNVLQRCHFFHPAAFELETP